MDGLGGGLRYISDSDVDLVQRISGAHVTPPPKRKPAPMYMMRDGHTLGEVADALGLSRERVRQIEITAIKKCRAWCAANGYDLAELLPQL